MYVCLCFAVSEKQLKKVISEGATTLEEVQEVSCAGMKCGACVCMLEKMLQQGETDDANISQQPDLFVAS